MHPESPHESKILAPLLKRHPRSKLFLGFLGLVILAATYAYAGQLDKGLGVTGLNRPVYMGFYIVSSIFFIGLAMSGTFISAVLRLFHAEWRRPLTRAAEAVSLFSLPLGAGTIILDIGRPERAASLLFYGRAQSPLLWDATAISLYLLSSVVFFYLSLLPDLALCRDRANDISHPMHLAPAWQRKVYEILALGWQGHPEQFRRLDRVLDRMAILMTVLFVAVHSVLAWVFGMTLQPGWHTALLGPFFLLGAIYSGLAAVVIILAVLRKVYHLEDVLPIQVFNSVRRLIIVFAMGWIYMMIAEFLTTVYGNIPEEMKVVGLKFTGQYALTFWTMVLFCSVLPLLIVLFRGKNSIGWMVAAAVLIDIGMWLERLIIVVPTEARPRLLTYLVEGFYYRPTLTEFAITAGLFAGLALLYTVFTQFFPIIPVWEIAEIPAEGSPVEEKAEEIEPSRRRTLPVIRME